MRMTLSISELVKMILLNLYLLLKIVVQRFLPSSLSLDRSTIVVSFEMVFCFDRPLQNGSSYHILHIFGRLLDILNQSSMLLCRSACNYLCFLESLIADADFRVVVYGLLLQP